MKYQFSNGDFIPLLGLGTGKSDNGQACLAVKHAIRIGYRHIDCAPRYENEPEIGQALHDLFQSGEVSREQVFITSKLWNNAHFPEDVLPALQQTLKDLRLTYLDLYLVHWPVALKPHIILPSTGDDFVSLHDIPIIETWQAMEECIRMGLVRHIGVSNFNREKLGRLIHKAEIKPEVNQIELHPFLQQKEWMAYARENGIHLTAYCPLGSPDRPSRLVKENAPVLMNHPVINKIAKRHGCSPAQILIRWAMQRGTSVIPKSSSPQRLRQNFEARNITLSDSDMDAIASLDRHYRYIHGEIWTIEESPYTLQQIWDD